MKSSVVHTPINTKERAQLGIRAGDTVRVWQKVIDKGKARRQAFEGLVLAVKHGTEPGATFTVRKVASGVGVEKIFPLYSPSIDSIELLRRAYTRRAKLYFIRRKAARDVKRAMRKSQTIAANTDEQAVTEVPDAAAQQETEVAA